MNIFTAILIGALAIVIPFLIGMYIGYNEGYNRGRNDARFTDKAWEDMLP